MFIVVESGATKTAWRAVCEDGSVRAVQTAGLSPTCLDLEHTQDIPTTVSSIYNNHFITKSLYAN